MLSKNRNYLIYALVMSLFAIGGYIAYVTSAELSRYFGFSNAYTIFQNQCTSIVMGIAIIFILNTLKSTVWFHRIGSSIFILSIVLLMLMVVAPSSMTPYISAKKLYIIVGGITLAPMIFFAIGALWFISFIQSYYKNIKYTNSITVCLMIGSALFSLEFHDIANLVLLEILLMSLLVFINTRSLWLYVSLYGLVSIALLFIFMAEHRVVRIKSWWELSSSYMTTLAIDSTLHENLFVTLIDRLGIAPLVFTGVLFLLLVSLLLYKAKDESYEIFTIGIVLLISISLILNLLYAFGLLPIYPPALYFLEYGSNTVIASSVMIGMLLMTQRNNHDRTR